MAMAVRARGAPKRGAQKQLSMDELLGKLATMEEAAQMDDKRVKDEKKKALKEEADKRKKLAEAKKKLNKDIASTKGAMKKATQQETKLLQQMRKLEQTQTVQKSKKNDQIKRIEDTIVKAEEKHAQVKQDLDMKHQQVLEAKGNLAYLTYAQSMLAKGIVPDLTSVHNGGAGANFNAIADQEPEDLQAAMEQSERRAQQLGEIKSDYERVREEAKQMKLVLDKQCEEDDLARQEMLALREENEQLRQENEALRKDLENADRLILSQADKIKELLGSAEVQVAMATQMDTAEVPSDSLTSLTAPPAELAETRRISLKVAVEVSKDHTDEIIVMEGDDPNEVARRFVSSRGLDEQYIDPIAGHIQHNLLLQTSQQGNAEEAEAPEVDSTVDQLEEHSERLLAAIEDLAERGSQDATHPQIEEVAGGIVDLVQEAERHGQRGSKAEQAEAASLYISALTRNLVPKIEGRASSDLQDYDNPEDNLNYLARRSLVHLTNAVFAELSEDGQEAALLEEERCRTIAAVQELVQPELSEEEPEPARPSSDSPARSRDARLAQSTNGCALSPVRASLGAEQPDLQPRPLAQTDPVEEAGQAPATYAAAPASTYAAAPADRATVPDTCPAQSPAEQVWAPLSAGRVLPVSARNLSGSFQPMEPIVQTPVAHREALLAQHLAPEAVPVMAVTPPPAQAGFSVSARPSSTPRARTARPPDYNRGKSPGRLAVPFADPSQAYSHPVIVGQVPLDAYASYPVGPQWPGYAVPMVPVAAGHWPSAPMSARSMPPIHVTPRTASPRPQGLEPCLMAQSMDQLASPSSDFGCSSGVRRMPSAPSSAMQPDEARAASPAGRGFQAAVHRIQARALREFRQNHRFTLGEPEDPRHFNDRVA